MHYNITIRAIAAISHTTFCILPPTDNAYSFDFTTSAFLCVPVTAPLQKEAAGGAGEEVKALAPEVLKRVEALSKLQEEFGEQHKAFVEEYKALQIKYQGVHAGLYAKRADIVSGKVDPAEAGEGKGKGIEGFWLQAMQNGRNTGGTIEEHDEPVLKALTDVRLEFAEGCDGYKISFHFAPNEYFENEVLTKTIVIPGMLGGACLAFAAAAWHMRACPLARLILISLSSVLLLICSSAYYCLPFCPTVLALSCRRVHGLNALRREAAGLRHHLEGGQVPDVQGGQEDDQEEGEEGDDHEEGAAAVLLPLLRDAQHGGGGGAVRGGAVRAVRDDRRPRLRGLRAAAQDHPARRRLVRRPCVHAPLLRFARAAWLAFFTSCMPCIAHVPHACAWPLLSAMITRAFPLPFYLLFLSVCRFTGEAAEEDSDDEDDYDEDEDDDDDEDDYDEDEDDDEDEAPKKGKGKKAAKGA